MLFDSVHGDWHKVDDYTSNWFTATSRYQASAIRGYAAKFEDRALRSVRTRSSNRKGLRTKPPICGPLNTVLAVSSL
jgi:hypothetical protein